MDLKVTLTSIIDNMVESGAIEKAITAAVEKAVLEAVTSSMRTYSDFGKQLEEAVKGALKLHGTIDLPSYNDSILKIVARQVESHTNAIIQKQVAERLKELLQPAPESITLSKLVEEYIEHVKNKRDAGCVCFGEQGKITLLVDLDRMPDFARICLDPEHDKASHQCAIQIGTHRGEVYSLTFGRHEVEKQLFVGPLYNFERTLFQMKAARSKIILDIDVEDIETTYELEHA
jgi:hypothetical protein